MQNNFIYHFLKICKQEVAELPNYSTNIGHGAETCSRYIKGYFAIIGRSLNNILCLEAPQFLTQTLKY